MELKPNSNFLTEVKIHKAFLKSIIVAIMSVFQHEICYLK